MVNGQHFSGTTYQLDGTENRDPILGIIVINPTLESIRETKITSQNYDAEFGQATAGVVSVQTKSGANAHPRQRLRVLPERQVPVAQSVHAVRTGPADGALPAGDQEESVRRIDWRTDREEPVVLLRRLRRDAQHSRRLAAGDGADRRGAPRRFQRLRRGDFRSRHRRAGVAHAVCEQPDPSGPAVTAGAGRPAADSGAQRARTRERHDRQLRRVGIGDLRRERLQRAARRTPARRPEHVRPLQPRRFPARWPAGVRHRRRRRARQPRRRLGCAQPESCLRRRSRAVVLAAGRLPVRLVQVPASTCSRRTSAPRRRRMRGSVD